MIKISGFRSVLHNSDAFNKGNQQFLESIEKALGEPLVWSSLEDYDCELKLIFVESGGSEGLFLKEFDKLKEPYYFLTSGSNNSLAASLEILTYLNLNKKKGEIIHGGVEYIASRIQALSYSNRIQSKIKNLRFGVFGTPSDWLISSVPEYKKLKDTLGIELVDVNITEVEDLFYKPSFTGEMKLEGFDKEELSKAERVSNAFETILKRRNLDGFTVRCFDLLSSIKTTGCLGLAVLNDKNYISTCEGDIMAMVSMAIANRISGNPVFQANPSRMDIEKNNIIFAHCTIPFNMVESFEYRTHFESGSGVSVKGNLKETDVTIFRMSSDLKHYFVSEGTILRNLDDPTLCRTQIEVHLENDIKEILKNPCGNHHIIFYGRHEKEIRTYLDTVLGE